MNKWYQRNKAKVAGYHIKRKFRLTTEEYAEKMANGCGLCGAKATMMDHCHKTGRLRGPLCRKHNLGLGMFNDDSNLLRKAADYVDLYR